MMKVFGLIIFTVALVHILQEKAVMGFLKHSSSRISASTACRNMQRNLHQSKRSYSMKSNHRELSSDVLVVGSGISGSTAAFYLNKQGQNVILADARNEVGGNLISRKEDGFLWEEGPNSFQPNIAILRLAKDLEMMDDLVLADPSLPRFVFWEGQLHALPSGLGDLLNFNLLSWPAKIRAAIGALGFISAPPKKEETIREWVTRHLGAETFERIIDPFVSGVYAGDPNKLSMRAALKKVKTLEDLGVTRGILDGAIVRIKQIAAEKRKYGDRNADLPKIPGGSLGSFRDGLQSIALKIKDKLGHEKVFLNHKLTSVKQEKDGWSATFESQDGLTKINSRALLLTSPAYVTSEVLYSEVLPAAWELKKINYPPVASVTLAYPNSAFKHSMEGFGNLIPRSMKLRTLGTIWSSSLFPGRAPPGYTMLLNYIGGAQDPQIANLSTEEIVDQVHADVQRVLLKDDAPRPKVLGVRLWPRAIPQYDLGHLEMLERIRQAEIHKPGLFLGGNYRTGVAFGDCVQFGADVADTVSSYLKSE